MRGNLGISKRGIAGKSAKKAVLAHRQAFFSLSAEPAGSVNFY
ncbi:hypothetical protein AVDCRST_MAG84-3206 [uncultured Microcoleus sp.]|uniref:Uncharacterized protein n=1 Tax=uncultured Microcoleus sp. TaxID=259945 RepID=A0A6J4ME57_9CYAN|nr:hypothetical protein AVDCRST_MAG84-3206 [uncultured Microcoleus sp.]